MLEAAEQFREAIRAAGLAPPDTIEADGHLRRFAGDGRRGSDASWYVLHGDGIPAGAFGDWRVGLSQTWRANVGRRLSPAEEAAHRARVEAMRQAREAEEARAHQEAAAKAAEILRSGRKDDISGHPYAAKKAIDFGPLVRRGAWPQRGWIDALLVPIYNADGQVISLEAINTSGDKDFLRGGAKRGGIHPIGNIKTARRVLIAEGIANAAVAIAALGDPAVAAMDAGNLKAAGETVRQINPGAELVFLADNDVREDGRNPGAEAATSAALALGGKVAIPELDGRKCDFWDLLHERGAEAVRRAVEAASAPPSSKGSPEGECALDVNLIRGCDIRPEPIEWIWGGWLAAGKMHILGGAPGGGKTTIALAFAATVTGNGRWPDGTRSSVGNVVIWSGEDDPADTLIPRLSLSGADLSRVYFIADIREGSERRSFDPARDMEPLRRKLAEIGGVKLLIVDPIVSAIAGDSHKNAEVRRGLQPLADLAASMRCALIGITHFSKGTGGRDPVERLTGSLAFGALARVVLVAAKHQEEGDDGRAVRLLLRAKSNIGPDDGGFEYDLRQAELKTYPGIFASSVLWGTAVEGAARELLAAADATAADGDGGTLVDAKRFLADLLADGPMPAKAIRADADGAGYSWTTIRRAQKALGIEPAKTGGRFGGGKQQWMWRLPEDAQPEHLQDDPQKMSKNAEDAQQNNVGTFCESDHLQGDSGFVEVEV